MSEQANKYKRRRVNRGSAEVAEVRDRWLISYADLTTLLLAVFIVLYASTNHQRAKQIATMIAAEISGTPPAATSNATGPLPGSDSILDANAAIERVFAANSSLRERARVTVTERGLVVSLSEAGFFAPGDATMRSDALPLLDALATGLAGANSPLRIEGHTDSLPIATVRYPSNWELSAARATTVLARLVKQGIPSGRLSVAGFAGERPIADNATAEGRAQNRRVDLVILRGNE